ncbi:PREDICTED: lipoxygenase homology domain-containing protein 1-like isoform X2 [Thamnophis sirtalis]|uniref:Lipoxygenase homology domain-containing protein 1-like isoform X2 n=1 Tax=Thamnophis sirtalis TaxID=35019 RepID=A0A6I9X829_9SAUR|nr:PREDICTED: lipoxygenase homology domain-containing protein 1-like isoform X2 [Thamnophis sirtalis]
MKQELWLLGKTNKESLTKDVHGIWDVTVIAGEMSDNYGNSKLILTVCDDKGTSAAVFIPKGSFKRAKIYQTSLELDKKFNKICKIRLEVEDSDRETWHCHEVKLQNKKNKETLEIPCYRDFPDNKGCTVVEFPILITGTRFLTVKQYILYISTDSAPKSGTDSDVYVTLKGTIGDTGRRKLFKNEQGCFSEGKVDVFLIEAVDIGTLCQLIVEKGKGSAWHLQKVMVKEPQYEGKETLFISQTWLRDTNEKKKYASLTLNANEVLDKGSTTASLLSSQNMKSEGLWKISFTTCREDSSKAFEEFGENITKLIWVFYGNRGKSEPISLMSKTGIQADDKLMFDVYFPSDLGTLYKVKIGVHLLEESIWQLFHHCKIQNTVTLDTFSLSLNETFPLLNRDQWLEFPIEWPLRKALSVITYDVKIFCSDIVSKISMVPISLYVYGTNGDTEDRRLLLSPSSTIEKGEIGQSFTGHIDAVDLGKLYKIVLLIGSTSSCKLAIKALHLKENLKQEPVYIFEVNDRCAD